MPYAAQVTQKIYDELAETWVDSPNKVLLTADSIDWAEETADGDTHVHTKSGTVVRVNQTLDQMMTWLNEPREVTNVP